MNVIKELAGHKSIETTLRYMHTDRAAKREAVNALRGTDAKRDVRAENREGASANADSWTVTSERSPLPT